MSTTLASLLPLPVAIPLVGALLSPLLARLHGRLALVVAVASTACSAGVLIALGIHVYGGGGRLLVHYLSAERPVHGKALGIALAADPFGVGYASLCAILGLLFIVVLMSEFGHIGKRELGGMACLTQLLLAALIAGGLTADSINLFVWFEVAAIASYGLTGFFLERPIALEAAFKNLVLTSMAGFAVFVGAAMLYSGHGALNLGQLHQSLPASRRDVDLVALALLISGFATKAGLVPFHGWLPDVHSPVPGAVSALFSALMYNFGILAIARIVLLVYGPGNRGHILGLLTTLGIVSAILGAVLALAQDDLKRLLGWDTVSQMGVLMVGFASEEEHATAGAVYHLVNHALFKALLFLCAGAIVHSTGVTKLSDMGGLVRRRPVVTVGFTVGALAISGVPPFNGYVSLGLIHEGLLEKEPVVYALALVAQTITVAALARATWLGFYRRRERPYERMARDRAGMRIGLGLLMAACVAFGVLPGLTVDTVVDPAASVLLHPSTYASAVLSGSGTVARLPVSFDYGKLSDLLVALAEIALGLVLAVVYLRVREPRPVTWLRRLHTGSVNDYAGYALTGLALVGIVLIG
jgi:multicomponent Na+:H+ antiporter subunit D